MKQRCVPVIMATLAAASFMIAVADDAPATASTPPPGAQVFTPPATIAADCSQDVTKPLYDWINTLPQGTPGQPVEVQFAAGGCYQVDGMLYLRGLTDFVFDGQGAQFVQSRVVNNELTTESPPPDRPAYCGFPRKFTSSAGTLPLGFDIMWFVEGGCDLEFENMTIRGTNLTGKPGGSRQQDSAFEFAGSQRVLVSTLDIDGVWGDFVTVTGLHEAQFGGISFPSFDVTITDNTFQHSGRQGIAMVYADRVAVTFNAIRHVAATAIDLEAEVGGGIEGNIDVADNTFSDYSYLVAAITYAQLFDFAFTSNKVGPTKIVLESQTKFPGHDLTIASNTASAATTWSNPYDILLTNEATAVVPGNKAKVAPRTPEFVAAGGGSGLIAVQNNVLDPVHGARRTFLPDPLAAAGPTVATGCGNASSKGTPLDLHETPLTLDQCVAVSPVPPSPAALPVYVASASAMMAAPLRAGTVSDTGPSGAQTGSVTCSGVSGTVTFDPPLVEGGFSPEVVLAQVTLTGCTGTAGATTPDTGYATASLLPATNDCTALEAGGASTPTSVAVEWSPAALGTSSISFHGFSLQSTGGLGFSLGGSGTTVSGSYPGADEGASTTASASSSSTSADQIAAACSSDDGLGSLTIDGGSLQLG